MSRLDQTFQRMAVPQRASKGRAVDSLGAVAKILLSILPADGASITNRAARALISQRLGREVSNDEYFAVRDELLVAHLSGRVRGQGRSVFRLEEPPQVEELPEERVDETVPDETAPDLPKPISERDLMFIARRALITQFPAELDIPKGSPDPLLEDISTIGPKSGVWARPDVVMVCFSPFAILPGMHVETHVFELKNEAGDGMKAVHEALAQGRFANYCHLVWLVPEGSVREPELPAVAAHCSLHGVGLIRLRLPSPQSATLEVLVDARKTPTTSIEIDGFLEARLPEAARHSLLTALK